MNNASQNVIEGAFVGLKTCTKCGIEKTLGMFCKLGRSKDGLYPSCKTCESEACAARYAADPEKIRARVKAYADANPEKIKSANRVKYLKDPAGHIAKSAKYQRENVGVSNAHKAAWLEKNPDKRRLASRGWVARNPDKVAETSGRWAKANPELAKANNASWRLANLERCAQNAVNYRANNPGRSAAACARRRSRLRTPAWSNQAAVSKTYTESRELGAATGVTYEVDHIFPIAGRTVSGLHTEANLRIVPSLVNRSKANKLPGYLASELWDPLGKDVYHEEPASA